MGDVVRTTTEPRLGEIRLAWWRERLEELDDGRIAPAEPRLQAVASELVTRGVTGAKLGEPLELAWRGLFEPFPWPKWVAETTADRGAHLFGIGSALLDAWPEPILGLGAIWSLVDVARHCSDSDSRQLLLEEARLRVHDLSPDPVWKSARPLAMLGALALRDLKRGEPFEVEGAPGRALAMARHRLTGRLPR